MNVLIVEDDPTDLKLAASILIAEGHLVAIAQSAEIALRLLADNQPHLILTDLELPGMDGVALVRRLKLSPVTANIPVVAVTAFPERLPSRKTQREAGFAAFITKPIDPHGFPALLVAASRH